MYMSIGKHCRYIAKTLQNILCTLVLICGIFGSMGRKAINVPYEVIEHDGQPARLYPDGAIRNERGHFIVQHPQAHTITTEDARAIGARKQERKRAILAASALSAVERGDLRLAYGDDAWIAEIGQAMQRKATNIDDPKMVDAARFLMKETGNADDNTGNTADVLGGLSELVRELAAFARAMPGAQPPADVIDAD